MTGARQNQPYGLNAKLQRMLAAIAPTPQELPARPFSAARALWLCRVIGCSAWNAPDRTHCRDCGAVRCD